MPPPDVARLAALRDREIEMKDEYWASQVDIQRRGADAWVMFAQGRKDAAIAQMRETADMEDLTDKSAVTPGPIAPARELLGYMLIENNQPKEALVEFEAVMKKEPNRFLAIYGAGKAAEGAKQAAKAKGYFKQLVEMCKDAGTERPELASTRARWRTKDRTGSRTGVHSVSEREARRLCDWRAIRLRRENSTRT